jgi:hypothetical protein
MISIKNIFTILLFILILSQVQAAEPDSKPDVQVEGESTKDLRGRKGLEFLAGIPEFRDLHLDMSERQLQLHIKLHSLASRFHEEGDETAYHLYTEEGENVIVMFRNGRCSGIQRMRPDNLSAALRANSQRTENSKVTSANGETKAVSDMNRKVARLNVGKSTIRDVIRVFGEPMRYLWGDKTFKKENLPGRYVAMYPNGFSVLIINGRVNEIRHEGPDGYSFLGKLQIGASPQEAVRVVGRPKKIVKGKPNEFADGVFYRDIDGNKGRCYYGRKDKGVRFFFMDNKISAIYVTQDDRSGLPQAFTVAFKAAGPSGPKTARELLDAFNENLPSSVRTHRFITKLKDGILFGYIQVDGQKGKEAIEKMMNENPKLALVIEEPAAEQETKPNAAVNSARAWLKIVDMGDYSKSWEQTAGLFKAMVSKEQLAQSLGMVRRPLGKVISRQVMSQKHTKTLPGLPPGQYVIIQFNTTFENKADAIETVTPMLDKDGLWRVSGYYIK